MRQHVSRLRLITLDPQRLFTLILGLCLTALAVYLVFDRGIDEVFYRLDVRRYEQRLGFNVGPFPAGAAAGVWGIVSVTPGGAMDQSGMRSGDTFSDAHGDTLSGLDWAISEAVNGRPGCLFVVNATEASAGAARNVCINVVK